MSQIRNALKLKADNKIATPKQCLGCGAVYDVEVGKSIKHYIIDFFIRIIDIWLELMDKSIGAPKSIKERLRRNKNTSGELNDIK